RHQRARRGGGEQRQHAGAARWERVQRDRRAVRSRLRPGGAPHRRAARPATQHQLGAGAPGHASRAAGLSRGPWAHHRGRRRDGGSDRHRQGHLQQRFGHPWRLRPRCHCAARQFGRPVARSRRPGHRRRLLTVHRVSECGLRPDRCGGPRPRPTVGAAPCRREHRALHLGLTGKNEPMSQRIEDYAVIGDLHSAALVGLDGSIDWLCLPHFDSASCFARLLGGEDHGYWKIAPAGGPSAILATRRWYRPNTLVVETEYDTVTGTVRVTDCMPVREGHPHLVRSVEGVSGTVDMRMELAVRFDYGEVVPWVTSSDGLTRLTAGPDSLALWHRVEATGKDMRTIADFTVTANQRFPFTLVWYPSHEEPPPPLDSYYAVHLTEAYWTEWATQCCYEGPYKDAVVRSLITLKALTYNPTGGIVAAATTSLPEALGGNRNWDYRFCWLRDATLTLESLMRGGYHDEAMAWRNWLLRAVAGDVSKLQIMYGPGGERRLIEWEIYWLPGYEGSAPVRIGNAASGQYQLDVYGEVMSALYSSARTEGVHSRSAWGLQ